MPPVLVTGWSTGRTAGSALPLWLKRMKSGLKLCVDMPLHGRQLGFSNDSFRNHERHHRRHRALWVEQSVRSAAYEDMLPHLDELTELIGFKSPESLKLAAHDTRLALSTHSVASTPQRSILVKSGGPARSLDIVLLQCGMLSRPSIEHCSAPYKRTTAATAISAAATSGTPLYSCCVSFASCRPACA